MSPLFNNDNDKDIVVSGVNADEDAAHAFKVFDRDGDGLITAEELRSASLPPHSGALLF